MSDKEDIIEGGPELGFVESEAASTHVVCLLFYRISI
jgi:hypothetical protein